MARHTYLPAWTQIPAERAGRACHRPTDDDCALSGLSAPQVWGALPVTGGKEVNRFEARADPAIQSFFRRCQRPAVGRSSTGPVVLGRPVESCNDPDEINAMEKRSK